MPRASHGLPGIYNATPITLNNGDGAAVALDVNGQLLISPGTGAASLGKAEDSAHTSGDVGIEMLAVRSDTAASTSGTNGDYSALITDNTGRLWVRVGIIDQLTPGTAAANLGKAEDAAHASGDTGIAMWGVRNDGLATTYGANGDYTPIAVDANGATHSSVSATPTVSTVSVNTTSTSVLASNSARKAVIFSNVGSNNIYLNLAGGTAVATNTLLVPNATLVLDRYVSTTAITGIAATGATNLSVTEMA